MDKLRILVTGAGAPGIAGTIYSLRNNFDNRPVEINGCDITIACAGRYLCDNIYSSVPYSEEWGYGKWIREVVKDAKIDVLIPQNTGELQKLSQLALPCKVLVSNHKAIELANNKLNVISGRVHVDIDSRALKLSLKRFGWPNKPVVIKPPVSNGMRGFRIIDESFNAKESFYTDKPDNTRTNWKALKKVLGKTFPELMVCEYLPGKEYSVDCLRIGDRVDVIPRERTQIRSGITFAGKVVKHDYIISECRRLAKSLDLNYCFGFQFKEDSEGIPRLLECNPRVQGTMVMSTLAGANVIWGAVKSALGETVPEFNIDWNSSFKRYWGGIDNKGIKI